MAVKDEAIALICKMYRLYQDAGDVMAWDCEGL